MKILLLIPSLCWGFDFSSLLGRIQSETMQFDRMNDEYKNEEEAGIRSVKLRERDIDRSLEAIKMRLHLDSSPSGASFLERHNHHHKRHHRKDLAPKTVAYESDEKQLEELEKKREDAQSKFLAVEENIVKMPERLFHTKEKSAKEEFNVPLEDEAEDDES